MKIADDSDWHRARILDVLVQFPDTQHSCGCGSNQRVLVHLGFFKQFKTDFLKRIAIERIGITVAEHPAFHQFQA
ncbi:hypothetical protein D3C87_1749410 [compost metagenome]